MANQDLTKLVREYVVPVNTVVRSDETIEQAVQLLRKKKITDEIVYIYVVDHKNRLEGIVPTRTLLLATAHSKIADIMDTDVVFLKGSQTLKEALEFLESHHLLALPVVDDKGQFLGVVDVQIYFEEKLDVAQAKRRRDIFRMLGFYLEEDGKKFSSFASYRNRMPWIFCNIFSGLACAAISYFFEEVLEKFLVLAMFIPLVLALSESISMQSMTQSLQRKTHGGSWRLFLNSIFIETKLLFLLALTCGCIVGIISMLWQNGTKAAPIIAMGIIISVVISGIIGASMPIFLYKRNTSATVAAGPIVLMSVDIITTTIYLSLATWILLS